MAKRIDNDIVELLNRAESDTTPKAVPMEQRPRPVTRATPDSSGGASAVQARQRADVPHPNRQTQSPRKRRSTFNIIRWLFASAIAIVLYISNILTVQRLAVEVYQLQAQYEKMQNANSVLQAEVNRKSGWERIGIAATQQGLVHATQKPQVLEVDEDRLERFRER